MDWQIGTVSVVIAAAAGYLARQSWRTWFSGKAGCSGSCACSARKTSSTPVAALVPPEQLTIRRRP